ncbi:uncharacterized protein LOC128731236 [Anopheles nili]|uniref:uncharacterized protein LOC128731236 n=1 Tax=Anopheles nili TaxID=185578 RepID=UPI00237AA65F|nr:uncharacterized protein LOC128731236 [Anopheles nili]
MAAVVNMTNLLNGKDSRWLQLEVCREYQRNKCSRPDTECKFAHPPANVEVQNGRVTACYDSIKGRCNREKPPCKYFHPPQHLKDQLLINGRNHLALKNALMQQMGISPGQPVLPGQVPAVNGATVATTVATAVPPAAAAALGFTLAWGTAPPPPYTTYVVSHSPSAAVVTHHNGSAPPPTNGVAHCNGTNGIGSTNTSTSNGSSTVNGHSHSVPGNNNNSSHCSNNNNNNTTTTCKATNPYLASMPASTYSPYFQPGHLVPTLLGPVSDPSSVSQLGPVVQQAVVSTQQKIPRSDRLEVCREFMRGACKRAESECRFAHPQESVTTHEDGSVTVCMDAVKGRCAREPCRYFHPPLHLQAQIKAAQSRATATAPVSAAAAVAAAAAAAAATMGPLQPPPPPPGAVTSTSQLSLSGGQSPLEVGKKRAADNDMIQMMDMKTMGSIYYENFAFPGMVPFKRSAGEKSGIPVYQPGATYQQLMQLQQPFVPVSCEYPSTSSSATAATYIPPASTATSIANSLACLASSSSSSSSGGVGGGGGGGGGGGLAAALGAASSASYSPSSMLLGGLYYSTSGAGGTSANVTSGGGAGAAAGLGWGAGGAGLLNNNSPKMSNKNAPGSLSKSMSLQSMASLGGSMTHLPGAANGQSEGGDLKETGGTGGAEKEDGLAGADLLTASSGSLSSSSATTTTVGSGAALSQSLATSSTQAVTVPVTSPLMQYSAVATSTAGGLAGHMSHQAASMQAQLQAAQVAAAAQHAHAVQAQAAAAATQNAALAAAAAAATVQYPTAGGAHYADAASMAKEVAHKNYALKLHGGSTALTGKPLTALGYTGVALNKGGLLPQPGQQYAAASATAAYPQAAARLSSPAVAVAAATPQQTLLAPSLTTRPPPPIMPQAAGAYPQLLRPQMPAAFGSNPYAAAAVAQQQLMNQGFMYPAAAAFSAGGYQFPMAQAGLPSSLTAIPAPVPQVSASPAAGSAVVLNPYKKMKTS